MTLKQAHVGQRLLFSIKRFFLETLSLSCTAIASLPMAAVSAVHLTVAHAGQARAVFIYAGITVAELGRLLGAALGVPPSCRTVGLRDSTTGSVVALALVASAPQALAPRRAYELVLEASGFAGGRLMKDAFAAFVDEMVARDLIDDEGADRVIALSEARDPLVRAAMELFLPSASASTSSSQGAQAAIDQLAASIVELAATTWSQLEARRSKHPQPASELREPRSTPSGWPSGSTALCRTPRRSKGISPPWTKRHTRDSEPRARAPHAS